MAELLKENKISLYMGDKHLDLCRIDYTPLEDFLSYGVQWEYGALSPLCKRIGNFALHKSLPIQSQYKGCVYDPTTKKVVYWLDPNDWSKKADGTASVLDGTDGQVCIHTPKFYGRSGRDGDNLWVRISMFKINDSWTEIPEMFIGAYRSTVNSTDNKAASVVNTTVAYRGGNNRTAYDIYLSTDPFRTDLGKPRTNIQRGTFRTWTRNLGAELLSYEEYKWIFYWAYVIEYANFNCQANYIADLTSDGLRQGGLGNGVTTWTNTGTSWSGYNGTCPLTPCGYGNSIGNGTGIIPLTIPETVNGSVTIPSKTFQMPRWRGFDNPFGDIWTNLDGIIISDDKEGNFKNVYSTSDPSNYGDNENAKSKMSIVGHEILQNGYTMEFDLGENAEIIPTLIGGAPTVGRCVYHFTNPAVGFRTLLVGGYANYGDRSGLGSFDSSDSVAWSSSRIGFRFGFRV